MNESKANSLKKDRQTSFDLQQSMNGDDYSVFVPKGHPREKEIRSLFEQMRGKKMTLAGRNIRFDDDKNRGILIDDMLVPFRSTSSRSRVARILLKHRLGERVSWDEIREHELMGFTDDSSELTPEGIAKFKRKITDAVDAINEQVQKALNTDDILFSRDDNQIFRYFIRNF